MPRKVDLSLWTSAPRMGQPLTGFIPFKSPIDVACAGDAVALDEEHEFTVSMFMERQASAGRNVGLCINLTSSQPSGARLYDTDEWARDWDAQYVSMPCTPPLPELTEEDDGAAAGQGVASAASARAAAWIETAPSEETVAAFCDVVGRFWAVPAHRRLHVAVHCATGINVAGVLIARFLMRSAPVGKVLAAFAKCRPPGIYAPNLLEAVWRAGAPPEARAKLSDGGWAQPQPPPWHPLPYRAIDRTSAAPPSVAPTAPTVPTASSPPKAKPAVPLFAPPAALAAPSKRAADAGALLPPPAAKRPAPSSAASAPRADAPLPFSLESVGRRLEGAEALEIRRACAQLLQPRDPARQPDPSCPSAADVPSDRLPCESHGAPLRRSHLEGMAAGKGDGWLVTWKAESVRCLLLVLGGGAGAAGAAGSASGASGQTRTLLLDSRGGVFEVMAPMQWPRTIDASSGAATSGGGGGAATHRGLVVGGEVVRDSEGGSGTCVHRLLCYDLLALHSRSVASLPLHKRLALLGQEVINPRKAPALASQVSGEALRVRQKDAFKLKHTPHLLNKFLAALSHPTTGLLFLRASAPLAFQAPLPPTEADGSPAAILDWRRDQTPGQGGGPEGEGGAVAMPSEAALLEFAAAHWC